MANEYIDGAVTLPYSAAKIGSSEYLDTTPSRVHRFNLRAATEKVKSVRFSRKLVALSITEDVVSQYLMVLANGAPIAIAKDNIDAINSIKAVIDLRTKAGAISHLDLAREQAEADLASAHVSLDAARAAFFPQIALTNTREAKSHLRREIAAAQEAFRISQLQYRQGRLCPIGRPSYTSIQRSAKDEWKTLPTARKDAPNDNTRSQTLPHQFA